MSNGDTAAEILDFVENEGADMPQSVTNKMIAMVLREKHQVDKEQYALFDKKMEAGFVRIEKRLDSNFELMKANSKRIDDIELARVAACAEQEARKKFEKETEAAKDKRFGRIGVIIGWLNDNALATIILTGIGTYILSLLLGG